MIRSQGEKAGSKHRTGLFLAGASQTASNVLFALAAVAVTAPLARESTPQTTAAVLAGYSLESLLVTALRNHLLLSAVYRHDPSDSLCRADVVRVARVLALACAPAFIVIATVCFVIRPSLPLAVAAAAWCVGMLVTDISRHCLVVFGKPIPALAVVLLFTLSVATASVFLAGQPLTLLTTISVLCLGSAILAMVALFHASPSRDCDFGLREAKFARGLALEGATSVAAVSAAQIAIARLSPADLVGYQIALQVAVSPALLATSGLTAPLITRARQRQARGESDLSVIAGWVACIFVGLSLFGITAHVASPIIDGLYGSAWEVAQPLIVPLLLLQGSVTSIFAILTRYRNAISPARIRRAWILVLVVGQFPPVAWLAFMGPGDLRPAILMAVGATLTVSVLTLYIWERGSKVRNVSQKNTSGSP